MKSIKSCSLCGESLITNGWATFKTGNICCSCFNHTVRHHFHVGAFSLTITQVPQYFNNLNIHSKILNILMPIMHVESDTFAADICNYAIYLAKYESIFNMEEINQFSFNVKRILNKYITHAYSNQLNIGDMFKAVNVYLIVREICRYDNTQHGKKICTELRSFIIDVLTINWLCTNSMEYYELASTKAYLCQYLGHIQRDTAYVDRFKYNTRLYNITSKYLNIWWAFNHKYDVVYHGNKYDKYHNVVMFDHDVKWENDELAPNFIDDERGE